jgi:hypothetical protein
MIARYDKIAAILRLVMFGGCFWWGNCSGLWGDDEFQRYIQRSDRITPNGGDAKEVNAIAQMIHPWPRGVGDRRIVADSPHMQHALERYRRGARPPDPMPDVSLPDFAMGVAIQPEKQQGGGGGGGGDAGGGGGGGGTAPAHY